MERVERGFGLERSAIVTQAVDGGGLGPLGRVQPSEVGQHIRQRLAAETFEVMLKHGLCGDVGVCDKPLMIDDQNAL